MASAAFTAVATPILTLMLTRFPRPREHAPVTDSQTYRKGYSVLRALAGLLLTDAHRSGNPLVTARQAAIERLARRWDDRPHVGDIVTRRPDGQVPCGR